MTLSIDDAVKADRQNTAGNDAAAAETQKYHELLSTLSEGSVRKNFDPYTDIAWDSPEFVVDPTDRRWILPVADPLGRHPWYQSQPVEKQIAIGMWRQANIMKVGLHFENALIRGIMHYAFMLKNGDPEFRYVTHEAAEECNHTLMFQEGVNRIGVDVPGMTGLLRKAVPLLGIAVRVFPELFFTFVLSGEEPIDHLQKSILRAGAEMPPMVERIMQIHVAEEARHISFAHEYLIRKVPTSNVVKRGSLSVLMPIAMRWLCDAIVIPPKEFSEEFDIPKSVIKELYWKAPESKEVLRDIFGDVRALARSAGLMNPVSKAVWKLCGIDGRESRYRSEPTADQTKVAALTRAA
ncbi:diiron oxygenase [Hoyosella rhizosphaerae]|uniref:Membrane protein n=1 Tax=Hoyosella rhizosphaerae TaxID=1755582 RepID=A0A916U8J5_9ACTN|nr:diiron oxygenase [Hoyosella rhizosphaerae]MBN4927736.1 diiron oxygenase [Hoyosella rhizosphaerae]GGC61991.1 membrane protein [Hoyosella rhizosphaerae]